MQCSPARLGRERVASAVPLVSVAPVTGRGVVTTPCGHEKVRNHCCQSAINEGL